MGSTLKLPFFTCAKIESTMAEYIGHILTALGLVIAGAVGFGVLRNIVLRTKEDTKDQEERLRRLEAAKLQWDAHIAEATGVLDRLRGIETSVATIQATLTERAKGDAQLMEILEANRMVLGELGKEIAVLKALRE